MANFWACPWSFTQTAWATIPRLSPRLGLTGEDVPTTWQAFFESLEPLAAKVAEVEGMTLFDGFEDYGSARFMLLDTMLASYMAYISQPGSELAFDTEAFRGALNALRSGRLDGAWPR